MDFFFDAFLYAAAAVTVLSIYGSSQRRTAPLPTPVPAPLPTPAPTPVHEPVHAETEPLRIPSPVKSVACAMPATTSTLVIPVDESVDDSPEPTGLEVLAEIDRLEEVGNQQLAKAQAAKAQLKKPGKDELRRMCSARGIKWRDLHGKHKHMSAADMRAALGL